MSISWAESRKRYNRLLKGLDVLIDETSDLVENYEQHHLEFANLMYEKGLSDIMKEADFLTDHEREFMLMYYSLKGQVERLKYYRKTISLMLIKDPINYPDN
ncbi:hypothetical protein JMN32_08000 [Fulvivirga sp. 29W222]|uniref:Uncharacterized protein n=1 Tax=Fulvivirga marina TaxID=2494733 RepID=A0A937G0H3_9BACT|nr:hypothetical protein [Fulvivirga marina]MBL6446246.1 hypothetical protein [Fulvivirga marina]